MPHAILSDRALIRIGGADAAEFLDNLVTCHVHGLRLGEIGAGALLSPQGKINWSFLIGRANDGFVLEVAAQDAADFAKRLKFYRLRAKVDISDPEMVSAHVAWGEAKTSDSARRDTRFKSIEVFRRFGEADDAPVDGDWTALRIAHGVAEAHLDYAYGEMFPHDVNLDQIGGVAFAKGCYVGQEVVSRMHHRGTARWRVMVASGAGLVSGSAVTIDGRNSGAIGSVSDTSGLAIVRLDRVKDALDKGVEILVGDASISVSFPKDVTFTWPVSTAELA
jgi:tRNA-modifying protein YgfZ